jgi:hypothetical protein
LPNTDDPEPLDPMMASFIAMSLVIARELGKRLDQEEAMKAGSGSTPVAADATATPISALITTLDQLVVEGVDPRQWPPIKVASADRAVPLQTLRDWIKKGHVRRLKIDGRVHVNERDIRAHQSLRGVRRA